MNASYDLAYIFISLCLTGLILFEVISLLRETTSPPKNYEWCFLFGGLLSGFWLQVFAKEVFGVKPGKVITVVTLFILFLLIGSIRERIEEAWKKYKRNQETYCALLTIAASILGWFISILAIASNIYLEINGIFEAMSWQSFFQFTGWSSLIVGAATLIYLFEFREEKTPDWVIGSIIGMTVTGTVGSFVLYVFTRVLEDIPELPRF